MSTETFSIIIDWTDKSGNPRTTRYSERIDEDAPTTEAMDSAEERHRIRYSGTLDEIVDVQIH